MIKKYISKFTIDILPSIIATIVGAYIVTHYINPKAETAKPAAAASSPEAPIDSKAAVASPAEKSADIVSAPAVPAVKPRVEKASIDKSDKDKDGVSAPVNGRHQPIIRDKAVAKAPVVVAPAAVVTPPATTAGTVPAAQTPEERHDANDLARAAIERLRTSKETQPAQEAARPVEPSHTQEAARATPPASLQQLPAPITVSTPPIDAFGAPVRPPYAADRSAESRGPVPPGDIPSPPLDLQASSSRVARPERTNVAEDVLSAAKSVFYSVIPKQFDR